MQVFLLVQRNAAAEVPAKLRSAFGEGELTTLQVGEDELPILPAGSVVLTYLSDALMGNIIGAAAEQDWNLAIMPHPQMRNVRIGFGVAASMEDAIEDFLAAQQIETVDLLRCNHRAVANCILIGNSAGLLLGIERGLPLWQRCKRFLYECRRLSKYTPTSYDLTTGKNKTLATAALGIVVVEHGANSLLSRRVLEESSIQDGMLHALILAPQSWLEMLGFLLRSIVLRSSPETRLPRFAGHIKTTDLVITSQRDIPHVIDGVEYVGNELTLTVTKGALRLFPGRHLKIRRDTAQAKEIYRVQSLPSADSRTELCLKTLPIVRHAATQDFKELFSLLRENTRATPAFLVLMVLSAILAAFGLYANSGPVIIGAMILAPLMAPIISLAMGISRQDRSLIEPALTTLVRGVALALGCAAFLALVIPLRSITSEVEARLSPNLLDLGVAIISGIAGAYAHARREVARSLAGVAIAVALVPPLVVSGIGLGWWNWNVFSGAMLLFVTNLIGILFAAAITFSLLGFSPITKAGRGLIFSLVMVLLISLPLGFSFGRMVDLQSTTRAIEGMHVDDAVIRDVDAMYRSGNKVVRCNLVFPVAQDRTFDHLEICSMAYQLIRERLGEEPIVEISVIHYSGGHHSAALLRPDTPAKPR